MAVLASSREVPRQGHLEEVVGGVDAVTRQMQIGAQMRYSSLGFPQGDFSGFRARPDVELSIPGGPPFRVSRDELSDG